ncbi:hypothetical protein [Nocardia terpenica]|uniref:Uncharacterized protein n=1 Tax=Nocardia terpenica TaxID=455432 RepID=A0A291RPY9_9NOCA|nr:hypothetical protein [Nocardia terpenica]ATL69385.1 hypothetical protein CRH09_27580 [Nocardia terpenica]
MNSRADLVAGTTADASYLAQVQESGLLDTFHALPYVAGQYYAPLLDEEQVLIEYCAPGILSDPARLHALATMLLGRHCGATAVVVRVPGDHVLCAPWERQLTYVRYVGGSSDRLAVPRGVVIREVASEQEKALVGAWLARALTDGSADQDAVADPNMVAAAVDDYLSLPGCISYLATFEGRPIGHATVLGAMYDEVIGREHTELLDVLVDNADNERRRAVTAALTAVVIEHAGRTGLPLLGQVVHPAASVAPGRGEAITSSLIRQGWKVDHVFWRWRCPPESPRNGE